MIRLSTSSGPTVSVVRLPVVACRNRLLITWTYVMVMAPGCMSVMSGNVRREGGSGLGNRLALVGPILVTEIGVINPTRPFMSAILYGG